eukprot:PITA_08777
MAFNCLRLEYALDGSSSYISWKDHLEVVLEDNGLKDFIGQEVPRSNDATQLAEWKTCVARARRIILEGVRDHIVSSLHGKEAPFEMWKTLKDLYQNSSDQRTLALKDKEEIRQSTRDGSSSSKHEDEENLVLATKAKKGKGKASQSKSSQGGKKFDKSKVGCFHCHELGHYATNCPRKKSKKGSSKESDGGKNLFSTLEEKDLQIRIEMGDDGKYRVLGEGLKNNIVSIAMIEDKGYDVVFSLGKVFLKHINTGQTKKIGIRVKKLYKLQVDDCDALISKAEVVHGHDISKLWHRRLGHLHHEALKIMQQISTGLPKGKLEQTNTCKGFTLGKYAKSSFQDRESRVGAILEQVHSDVCMPFSTTSTSKQRYFVIFIDDFPRRCWIYFMQKKDQTFLRFCEFKALAKKESGMKVKALWSDNGGEYVSQ